MSQVVTAPILTDERSGQTVQAPVEASTNLYAGTIGALNAAGNATFAQDIAGGLVAVGRCETDALNSSGAAGALSVNLKRGVFKLKNSSRSGAAYALAAADVGDICFVEDEQTVQKSTGSTYKVKAGIFLGLDPDDGGAWVDMRLSGVLGDLLTATQNTLAGNTGGTAATPSAGTRTIATIVGGSTDATAAGLQTTQNAIADLVAELNAVKADIAAIKALL